MPKRDCLIETIKEYAELVQGGRCLAIIWDPGLTLSQSLAVESISTSILMGRANSRGEDPTDHPKKYGENGPKWSLFGTLAVKEMNVALGVVGYKFMIVFRKNGPRSFERRHSASLELLRRSKIDVEAKAFTRDFANNVWHFAGDDVVSQIVHRLSYLLTWDDEVTVSTDMSLRLIENRSRPIMETQQIPVAKKEPYYLGLTLFSDIEINRLT